MDDPLVIIIRPFKDHFYCKPDIYIIYIGTRKLLSVEFKKYNSIAEIQRLLDCTKGYKSKYTLHGFSTGAQHSSGTNSHLCGKDIEYMIVEVGLGPWSATRKVRMMKFSLCCKLPIVHGFTFCIFILEVNTGKNSQSGKNTYQVQRTLWCSFHWLYCIDFNWTVS